MITTVSTPAVHADTELNQPAAIVLPVRSATPSPVIAAASNPTPAGMVLQKSTTQEAAQPANQQAAGAGSKKHFNIFHGLASWYGGVFNGRKTASGEKFDKNALTACHPTLPFGSLVKVINRSNKRSVVVRINDRGDLGDGDRVIDLSFAAAKKLSMVESGLARVDVQVLSVGHGQLAN